MSMRVLLVEDDRELRSILCESLRLEGYLVDTAASMAEAQALLKHSQMPDLVLLDLGLPDGDGEVLLQSLPAGTPALVISARQQDGVKVRLLDAGAADYLVKPFSISELLARMRAALRHRGVHLRPALTRYQQDGLVIDLAAHQVSLHGELKHLTPTEFKLLARLVRNAGQVVTHSTLLADVWGAEFTEHTHYLRLYMAQLRSKLEAVPADPHLLLTEPGVGYRLLAEAESG